MKLKCRNKVLFVLLLFFIVYISNAVSSAPREPSFKKEAEPKFSFDLDYSKLKENIDIKDQLRDLKNDLLSSGRKKEAVFIDKKLKRFSFYDKAKSGEGSVFYKLLRFIILYQGFIFLFSNSAILNKLIYLVWFINVLLLKINLSIGWQFIVNVILISMLEEKNEEKVEVIVKNNVDEGV